MIKIRGAGRKEYYNRLLHPMKIQLLKEATHRRDKLLLQRALAEAKEVGIGKECEEYVKAKKELDVVLTRIALRDAVRLRDSAEIYRMIRIINDHPLYLYHLQHDVIEAERIADDLERVSWYKRTVLHMDKKAMTEIRRYHKPPQLVHDVMKGVLLLLGVDEERSDNWRECQHFLNPYGKDGMNRKVLDFDTTAVDPEIAARTREILEGFLLEDVQEVSPALGTFYVWALGMVDLIEKHHNSHGIRPANIRRQKAIFCRNRTNYLYSMDVSSQRTSIS